MPATVAVRRTATRARHVEPVRFAPFLPMFLRRVLIRLLLLAVCFHTVVGLPAHEASHIQQRIARAAAALADGRPPPAPVPVSPALASAATAAFLDADARTGPSAAGVQEGADVTATGAGGHGGPALETLCAWCAAYAQIASAFAASPPAPPAAVATGPAFPRDEVAFVPRPERWRFAARDPPAARAAGSAPPSPSSSS